MSVLLLPVIVVTILLIVVLFEIARKTLVDLGVQQMKGSLPHYVRALLAKAVAKLPPEMHTEAEQEWAAELSELEDRPFSALRFVWGLRSAATEISREPRLQVVAHRTPLMLLPGDRMDITAHAIDQAEMRKWIAAKATVAVTDDTNNATVTFYGEDGLQTNAIDPDLGRALMQYMRGQLPDLELSASGTDD